MPWSGKVFSSLPEHLQEAFLAVELSVVVIDEVSDDEVRDLFIRLQSGTPLTAQQVRDAWPGSIGPFIERLAGKGTRQGAFTALFAAIDRRGRGSRSDDEYDDPFLEARQTCAQLLTLLLAKERGRGYPSLRGTLLNDLYHENTDFDTQSSTARKFEELLALTEKVVEMRPVDRKRKAVRKSRVFSLFLFLRTLTFSPVNLDRSIPHVADLFWLDEHDPTEPLGTVTTAENIENHYLWMLQTRMAGLNLPELDRNRLFSIDQKSELWARFAGKCGICSEEISPGEEEYDHVKPWILGGPTSLENGRPVHARCHRRGLARSAFRYR
ncbi:MAG: HNH endonuclease [Actinobacteria bacterium]|nr:HNH endonuclease [Actinomycetota bacterium]MBU1609832.1 HNH endonuclease [Actinomycetota bacterium]MBU2316818.1 HNH endonuclease [Actinomycetota bacterium]MBU2385239.1 HNH endonuclease [Actinomycetota bacterium]